VFEGFPIGLLVKSFEVDSSHMPLSSEVKSSRMWRSRRRSTWGRFQPQVGSCFCTAATRRSSWVIMLCSFVCSLVCFFSPCILKLLIHRMKHQL